MSRPQTGGSSAVAGSAGRPVGAVVAVLLALWPGFVPADELGQVRAAWIAGEFATVERGLRGLAESGHARAQLLLGYLNKNGKLGRVDDTAARHWYRRAADQGIPEAQYELGLMHELGYGGPVDAAEAEYWYGRAIDHGYCPGELDIEAYWHDSTPLSPIRD